MRTDLVNVTIIRVMFLALIPRFEIYFGQTFVESGKAGVGYTDVLLERLLQMVARHALILVCVF